MISIAGSDVSDTPTWWDSFPDGVWALFGVVVTVAATATLEYFRRRHEREAALRAARIEAHSALIEVVSRFVMVVGYSRDAFGTKGNRDAQQQVAEGIGQLEAELEKARWRSQIVATEKDSKSIGRDVERLVETTGDIAAMSAERYAEVQKIAYQLMRRLRQDVGIKLEADAG